jgi:hypothetical protein
MNWYTTAQANLGAIESERRSEADTRRLIIEPILAAISYDVWDARGQSRIEAESSIEGSAPLGGRGRADYLLYSHDEPCFAVEAKPSGSSLSDLDAAQVCNYCLWHAPRIRWGVLTNGGEWRLYDTQIDGAPEQKKVLQWDLKSELGPLVMLLGPERAKDLSNLVSTLSGIHVERHRNSVLVDEAKELWKQLINGKPSPGPGPTIPSSTETLISVDDPKVSFTQILEGDIGGKKASDWNKLVRIAINLADSYKLRVDEIVEITGLNLISGSSTDNGFHPVDGCLLSVQSVDANKAARALIAIARRINVRLFVKVRWQPKAQAAYRGQTGLLRIPGGDSNN